MRAGRIILISLGILLVILFFSTFINSTPKEEILIGAILPLTGNGADQGQAQAKAVQLVINEVNSKGGINGQKVELLLEDSKGGSAQEALIAYDKIKLSKKPLAIITWGSGVGIALTKLMNDDKIIQMGVATSSQKYSTANDFTFRVFPDARFEGAFDANFVFNKLNISTVCIIYTQNDYGVGSKSAFESSFSAIGGKVSCVESVDSGAKDVRSQLIKIKEKNPQLIFMGVYPSEGSSVLSQAKELDLNSKFIATSA
ncbi:MAG: ABC transporter substrate-binding protein, partial [archaeon]